MTDDMQREAFAPYLWHDGKAGDANIVRFDGADVVGVARIDKESTRLQLIRFHNNALREAIRHMREQEDKE